MKTIKPSSRTSIQPSALAAGALIMLSLGASTGCESGHATEPAPLAMGATTAQADGPQARGVTLDADSRAWVTIEPVALERFAPSVTSPGRFELREAAVADVAVLVAGRVVAVHVIPGDDVAEGDPIVTLESPDAVATRFEVANSRAELVAARDAVRRQVSMAERGVGLEVERMAAQTRLLHAQSAVARAERAAALLGDGEGSVVTLKAPRAGTVLERMTAPGAWVSPDSGPVAKVGDPDSVWFVAQVFERDLGAVSAGTPVEIETANGATLRGKVVRLSRVVDTATRRAAVHIELERSADTHVPRPGTWARAKLAGPARDSLVVPLEAVLLKGQGESSVYVEEAGVLVSRVVRLGERDGQRVEVVSGIEPGAAVVKRGALLVDGQADMLL